MCILINLRFIFARIFLKEKFGQADILALILSLIGIAFASRIELFFRATNPNSSSTTLSNISLSPDAGLLNTTFIQNRTNLTSTNQAYLLINQTYSETTQLNNNQNEWEEKAYKQLIGTLFALASVFASAMVFVTIRKVLSFFKFENFD